MDQIIRKTFEEAIKNQVTSIIISNSSDREKVNKIKIRPVMLKEVLYYQVSEYIGTQVFHTNYQIEELYTLLPNWFEGLFRQAEITTRRGNVIILISKKGKVTVMNKGNKPDGIVKNQLMESDDFPQELSHNKKKKYILQENVALPFLIDLGVMNKDGAIIKAKSDKFRQINRFLEYVEDILPHLDKGKELTILDFGCGKSYLTFALYYYLRVLKEYQINIIGLDLKTDVIKHCNELAKQYGYDRLHFLVGDIASYTECTSVDMVVTLHACDTATDHALYKAVNWGAKVILSVPCCQHELNQQIKSTTLKPILKYGIVKERMAALITDALRAELLEQQGYRVQLLEFIDMEHTPKNILIRAVLKDSPQKEVKFTNGELESCMEFLGVNPCLLKLFRNEK